MTVKAFTEDTPVECQNCNWQGYLGMVCKKRIPQKDDTELVGVCPRCGSESWDVNIRLKTLWDLDQDLMKKCLVAYGADRQMRQTEEECGELIVALEHYGRDRASRGDVLTELVDVQNMIHEMLILLQISPAEWNLAWDVKHKRVKDAYEVFLKTNVYR